MSQKETIVRWLEYIKEWMPAYKLRSIHTPFGWIGSQGDRRARELAGQGLIERRLNGKYAEYRIKEKQDEPL